MKTCNICGINKPLSDYYKYSKSRSHHGDGYETRCKMCVKEHAKTKDYRIKANIAHKERMKDKEYRDKINSYSRDWQRSKYAGSEEYRKNMFARYREWVKTERGKKLSKISRAKYQKTLKYKKAIQRYRDKFPEKRKAHTAIANAISSSKINRPTNCSVCDCVCIPEAHHPDYSKQLFVIWMCRRCHNDYHLSTR